MVDGILVRFCEVMGAFYLDSFVLHEIQVRGNIWKQRDDWPPTLDSLIMCSGLMCYGRHELNIKAERSEEGGKECTFERAMIRRRRVVRIRPTGGDGFISRPWLCSEVKLRP